MRIAIVTETFLPSTDGIVTRLCETIRWLKKQKHDVLVIAPDLGVHSFEGVPVRGVPARHLFFYRTKKFALPSRRAGSYLAAFHPDLVHVVNPALIGLSGIYYARKFGCPLVASYHTDIAKYMGYYHLGVFKPVMWRYLRWLHNKADLNLCTSQTVEGELNRHDFKNVRLWRRGVDLTLFSPGHRQESVRSEITHGHPDCTILLYVGRLAAEKQIERIREALDASPDLWLVLAGDGPYRTELEKAFQNTQVTFTGCLHGDELAKVYASADLFVFPSTTETLGLVILEAMASGLPVVAAESGPSGEQIQSGWNGLLYHPDVRGDLGDTVLRLRPGTPEFSRMKINARQTSTSLGWSKASAQLFDYYRQAASVAEAEKRVQLV